MKAAHLLWLLVVALAANAQSSNGTEPTGGVTADPGGNSGSSVAPSSPPPSSPPPSSPPPTSDPPTSTPPTSTPPTSTPPTSAPPPQSPSVTVEHSVSVDPDTGDTTTIDVTSTITNPPSNSASASNTAAADTNKNNNDSGGGLSTGGIIGLAVAGGTALVCLIGFIVWKVTHKRSSDFDDNENIKWPELNAHSSDNGDTHAMPVTNTGRSGFIDGEMSRAPSVANTYAASSSDFHSDDPYAVPPLPHMNPGVAQPYHDDPNAAPGGYYDPYRGPVPQTFNEATHGAPPADWGGNEAIPMTQMAGGRGSPAPGMMYGDTRTMSPGPQAAYAGAGRAPSPGPQAAYAGRASPGPQYAYTTGRASPGPGPAYGGA